MSKLSEFVGFLVSERVHDLLRLQALIQEKSKGTVLRDVLLGHIDKQNWTAENLQERYAKHLYSRWNMRWRDTVTFEDFMEKSRVELRVINKLPDKLIEPIIEICEEHHRIQESLNK